MGEVPQIEIMNEYAIRKTGFPFRRKYIICRLAGDGKGYCPLQQEDSGQKFLDFLMEHIRNNRLRDDRPWEFYLSASSDSFDGIKALVDEYHYPISCCNMELKIIDGRVRAYSTSSGIEFD